MKSNKLILISFLVLAALVLVFAGCSEKSLKGKLLTSQPPSIFWAQVPNDSLNHHNPLFHWFSTDQDGVVLDYQYTVLLASTVDSLRGASTVDQLITNFPAGINWTIIHTDSATIPLYSTADTLNDGTPAYVDQYVFIKAMDEDSLFSGIIYKHVARNNHPPTCYLVVPTEIDGVTPMPQWCLPETTGTWKGIRVAWVGKDSIDIPGSIQPDFEWNIRLYGPFMDSANCAPIPESLYMELTDPLDSTDVWITAKQKFLTNLKTGYYLVSARNRDDAFTPSKPATAKLIIYEPTWIRNPSLTKPILVANHSYYYMGTNPLDGRSAGELLVARRDSVRNFYMQLIQNAGYDTATEVDWKDYQVASTSRPVQKADLYNHRMVILIDTDYTKALKSDIQEPEYSLYLDVDGMIWIIGRRVFDEPANTGLIEFNINGDNSRSHSIAYRYFNLQSVYSQPLLNYGQAEFAGAQSIVAGFPDLAVDTLVVAQCNWARVAGADTTFYRYSRGLIGVDYLSRRSDVAETIYKYRAINPDTSRFDAFPVAVRYDRGTYKTSYFCFPLYFIQRDQAQVVMQQMLDWFNPRDYLLP